MRHTKFNTSNNKKYKILNEFFNYFYYLYHYYCIKPEVLRKFKLLSSLTFKSFKIEI